MSINEYPPHTENDRFVKVCETSIKPDENGIPQWHTFAVVQLPIGKVHLYDMDEEAVAEMRKTAEGDTTKMSWAYGINMGYWKASLLTASLDEDSRQQSDKSDPMTFEKIMEQIGGDWGNTAFFDEVSQMYIQIAVTYDYDFIYRIFNKEDVVFDEEINDIIPLPGAKPLAYGHYDPEANPDAVDGSLDPENEFAVHNKYLKEILSQAKNLNEGSFGNSTVQYFQAKAAKIKSRINEIVGSTWFALELCDDGDIDIGSLVSRRYGDIEREEAGGEDIAEGNRIGSLLSKALGEEVAASEVDEWVMVEFNCKTLLNEVANGPQEQYFQNGSQSEPDDKGYGIKH